MVICQGGTSFAMTRYNVLQNQAKIPKHRSVKQPPGDLPGAFLETESQVTQPVWMTTMVGQVWDPWTRPPVSWANRGVGSAVTPSGTGSLPPSFLPYLHSFLSLISILNCSLPQFLQKNSQQTFFLTR